MISFTNIQINDITKNILLIPSLINDPSNGYIAQKNLILQSQDSLLTTDNGQKVFSDHFISVIQKYYDELVLLNNEQRTIYSDSDLISGGKQTGGHFPSSTWINLTPKVIPSNTGLPITTLSNKIENDYISDITTAIDLLKNGFNEGTASETVTVDSTSTMTAASLGSFVVGGRYLVSGSDHFLAKITSIEGTSAYTIHFELIAGTTFNGSATATQVFTGFSNLQRAEMSSVSPYNSIFTGLKGHVDNMVNNWVTVLNNQKTILTGNDDLGARKVHNQNAISNIDSILSEVTTWLSSITSGLSGKYSDTGLLNITNLQSLRLTQIPARALEIGSDLGTLSQAPDGSYTGSGVYLDLFKVIDIRISRGSGTLFQYHQIAIGISLFDKKIATANDQLTQYNNTFALTKVSSDTVIGQQSFPVESIADFSNGDTVYVMDNESLVYSRTISSISGDTINLDSGIPAVLKINKLARIAKQK